LWVKSINGTAKICDFSNDIKFNRSQITLDERDLCLNYKTDGWLTIKILLDVKAIDTVKHYQ